jgi:hypothetical protein
MSEFLNNLLETTNLLLFIGFGVVAFFLWLLTNIAISINEKLDRISNVSDSLYEINQRMRRKGAYKDKDEANHSQFMED